MIEEASNPLLENPVFDKELHVFLFENPHPVESEKVSKSAAQKVSSLAQRLFTLAM